MTSASAASWSTLSGESDPNQGLAAQEMQRLRDIAVQDSDTSEDEFHDCQEGTRPSASLRKGVSTART